LTELNMTDTPLPDVKIAIEDLNVYYGDFHAVIDVNMKIARLAPTIL